MRYISPITDSLFCNQLCLDSHFPFPTLKSETVIVNKKLSAWVTFILPMWFLGNEVYVYSRLMLFQTYAIPD